MSGLRFVRTSPCYHIISSQTLTLIRDSRATGEDARSSQSIDRIASQLRNHLLTGIDAKCTRILKPGHHDGTIRYNFCSKRIRSGPDLHTWNFKLLTLFPGYACGLDTMVAEAYEIWIARELDSIYFGLEFGSERSLKWSWGFCMSCVMVGHVKVGRNYSHPSGTCWVLRTPCFTFWTSWNLALRIVISPFFLWWG